MVGNVDLAPTFESIAGLRPEPERAGSGFLPACEDPAAPSDTYTFFEHTYSKSNPDTDPDFDSDLGGSSVTLPATSRSAARTRCSCAGTSTSRWAGKDYAYELYDYTANPYERTNVYARSRNQPWVQDMQTQLEQYATCTPAECRAPRRRARTRHQRRLRRPVTGRSWLCTSNHKRRVSARRATTSAGSAGGGALVAVEGDLEGAGLVAALHDGQRDLVAGAVGPRIVATRESAPVIRWSSTLVTTSPRLSPALLAGGAGVDRLDPGAASSRPLLLDASADRDAEPGVGRGLALAHLVDDRHDLVDRDREAEADRAAGSPLEPALVAVRIEELMPTTSPVRSTSGPPVLPGLIAASVWIAG